MSQKYVYKGHRAGLGTATVTVNGKSLPPRNDVMNHSPTGFEWGYGGSGPAQLALAILCHEYGDVDFALIYYQKFKFQVVALLTEDAWELTSAQVRAAVKQIQEQEM